MKLKTLKDLDCIHACDNRKDKYCDACGTEESHSIDEQYLKQEAIKWIKELETHIDTDLKENGINELELHAQYKIEWIKNFFNITDGDLNE